MLDEALLYKWAGYLADDQGMEAEHAKDMVALHEVRNAWGRHAWGEVRMGQGMHGGEACNCCMQLHDVPHAWAMAPSQLVCCAVLSTSHHHVILCCVIY